MHAAVGALARSAFPLRRRPPNSRASSRAYPEEKERRGDLPRDILVQVMSAMRKASEANTPRDGMKQPQSSRSQYTYLVSNLPCIWATSISVSRFWAPETMRSFGTGCARKRAPRPWNQSRQTPRERSKSHRHLKPSPSGLRSRRGGVEIRADCTDGNARSDRQLVSPRLEIRSVQITCRLRIPPVWWAHAIARFSEANECGMDVRARSALSKDSSAVPAKSECQRLSGIRWMIVKGPTFDRIQQRKPADVHCARVSPQPLADVCRYGAPQRVTD